MYGEKTRHRTKSRYCVLTTLQRDDSHAKRKRGQEYRFKPHEHDKPKRDGSTRDSADRNFALPQVDPRQFPNGRYSITRIDDNCCQFDAIELFFEKLRKLLILRSTFLLDGITSYDKSETQGMARNAAARFRKLPLEKSRN